MSNLPQSETVSRRTVLAAGAAAAALSVQSASAQQPTRAAREKGPRVWLDLDQKELDFDFDRPARFLDMEGGEAVLADPSLIARNYREAVRLYLAEMDELVRTTGMDYHRVKMHEPYDEVLVRFLLRRTPKRGSR